MFLFIWYNDFFGSPTLLNLYFFFNQIIDFLKINIKFEGAVKRPERKNKFSSGIKVESVN